MLKSPKEYELPSNTMRGTFLDWLREQVDAHLRDIEKDVENSILKEMANKKQRYASSTDLMKIAWGGWSGLKTKANEMGLTEECVSRAELSNFIAEAIPKIFPPEGYSDVKVEDSHIKDFGIRIRFSW